MGYHGILWSSMERACVCAVHRGTTRLTLVKLKEWLPSPSQAPGCWSKTAPSAATCEARRVWLSAPTRRSRQGCAGNRPGPKLPEQAPRSRVVFPAGGSRPRRRPASWNNSMEATYAQETRVDVGGESVRDGHCFRPIANDSANNQQPAGCVGHKIGHEAVGTEIRHEGVRNEVRHEGRQCAVRRCAEARPVARGEI